jgi:hypothetical protein
MNDFDGSPILILTLKEAELIHEIIKADEFEFIGLLEAKFARFLEEAHENRTN